MPSKWVMSLSKLQFSLRFAFEMGAVLKVGNLIFQGKRIMHIDTHTHTHKQTEIERQLLQIDLLLHSARPLELLAEKHSWNDNTHSKEVFSCENFALFALL